MYSGNKSWGNLCVQVLNEKVFSPIARKLNTLLFHDFINICFLYVTRARRSFVFIRRGAEAAATKGGTRSVVAAVTDTRRDPQPSSLVPAAAASRKARQDPEGENAETLCRTYTRDAFTRQNKHCASSSCVLPEYCYNTELDLSSANQGKFALNWKCINPGARS